MSIEQFEAFWAAMGIESDLPTDFHPFWCEIAAVEVAPSPDAPPQIEEILWPTLAATSPLYFTHSRIARPVHDLSHGWGSNSGWSTHFRRDYVWGQHLICNADGAPNFQQSPFLAALTSAEELEWPAHRFFASNKGDNGALTLAQREELLIYRGFARTRTDADDFWPYDDTLLTRAP